MSESPASPRDPPVSSRPTRRGLLSGLAAGAVLGAAGCLGGGRSRVPADALSAPVLGDPDAAVTVAVYEDFACPHCRTYSLEVFPRIAREFVDPGAVRYEHHDFPIPVDPTASWRAASAARAVQDRAGDETFFRYAKRLYEAQSRLGLSTYAEIASDFELDGSAVRSAAEAESYRKVIDADRSGGKERGVRATPTVFVNDRSVRPSYRAVAGAIEDARS